MYRAEIDARELVKKFTDLERAGLARAALRALNFSAFDVRQEWLKIIPTVFDRPVPLTQRAPLYKKATIEKLVAEVFIRDDATKGTPPAQYLLPQVVGGPRAQKRSERSLNRVGLPPYFVPGKGARLDRYGNIPGGTITAILSDLRAHVDPHSRSNEASRARRRRRGKSTYFALREPRGNLKPGVVYERVGSAFGSGVRSVLFGVNRAPTYFPRYDVFALTESIFHDLFEFKFRQELSRLVRA